MKSSPVRSRKSGAGKVGKKGPGGRVETSRLLPLILPVTLTGTGTVLAAAWTLAASRPSPALLLGVAALFAAATFAEAFPVPIEGVLAGGVSLAIIFLVGAAVLYGWAPAAIVAFLAQTVIELTRRGGRNFIRLAYNSSVYALGGAAAGFAAHAVTSESKVASFLLEALLGSTAFCAVNIILVAAVVARSTNERFVPLFLRTVYSTIVPFAIMASVAVMLAALWRQSPLLAPALIGPLVATALYQRSVHSALSAMRLALTDPLTGLGNHRHFHERLQRDLDRAEAEGTKLTLCLLDVDDFKQINDRYGHPVGDRVLAQLGAGLRHGGEAFRLGGDEFALLLPRKDEHEGRLVGEAVLKRVAEAKYEHGEPVSVSLGLATYPDHALDRSDLHRFADNALYWAKGEGKNRVRAYRPDMPELGALRLLGDEPDRAARLRAAAGLAYAVDARDAYTGSHSQRVGDLAARVAVRLALPEHEVDLIRLAGTLHDLGKLGISQEILQKRTGLSEGERRELERHPEIGYAMLEPLDVEPVATWVLHHHERWDGAGYPHALAGEAIPLGARIIFVADAFDAMTSERTYQAKLPDESALEELAGNAGTQFDPAVVDAFVAELSARAAA